MKLRIRFLGAAGTVTGSRFLLETPRSKVLVDCGLFQGQKKLRERNWNPLPLEPSEISTVVLTHGHLDHCGWLPRLVRDGFGGRVLGTAPTTEIAKLILADSGRLQEEQAEYANRKAFSKHKPALPCAADPRPAAPAPGASSRRRDHSASSTRRWWASPPRPPPGRSCPP